VALYYHAFAPGASATGTVSGNAFYNYQKGGIVVNGPGATASVSVKKVVGSTTRADGNDIGVALANYDSTCSTGPSTATNNKAINNTIANFETTNVSGSGYPVPYQAGILDSGVNDKLINNAISGVGYNPASGTGFFAIDTSGSTAAKVHANPIP
jgi:hypothetical protein